MNLRRLYVLLVVWFFLLIAPSAMMLLGVFGHVDARTNINGHLALAWILGYLAQFGVFMWIMSMLNNQTVIWRTILWYLAASLLPWVLDWTPPSAYSVIGYAAAIALAFWIGSSTDHDVAFKQRAVQATGTVIEVLEPKMNMVINNVYIKRKVRLNVEREDSASAGAPTYEAVLDGLFMLGEIPSPGDHIPLLVDPKNPQRVEYCEADSTSSTASADTRSATRPAPSRHVRTPSAPSSSSETASGSSGSNITDDLVRLADLRDRGVLNDSEFEAAKQKLLNG